MGNVLVAYFSATGTTEILAKKLATAVDGDLHKIITKRLYTTQDLNWMNGNSRSSVEMKNTDSRPEITNMVQNIDEYDTIYVGFPIWWYIAPTIINTFLEKYNLYGKTIIPFATSGGSGMGRTNDFLKDSCYGAILKSGRRFNSSVTVEELREWSNSL